MLDFFFFFKFQPITQVSIAIAYLPFFLSGEHGVPCKGGQWRVQLNCRCSARDKPHASVEPGMCQLETPNVNKTCTQGLAFNNMNNISFIDKCYSFASSNSFKVKFLNF